MEGWPSLARENFPSPWKAVAGHEPPPPEAGLRGCVGRTPRGTGSTSEDTPASPTPLCVLNYIPRQYLNLGSQLYYAHKEHLFSNKNILAGAGERWKV